MDCNWFKNKDKNHSENADTSTSVTLTCDSDTKTNCNENITPPRFSGGVKMFSFFLFLLVKPRPVNGFIEQLKITKDST